jgi:hypothetical protein
MILRKDILGHLMGADPVTPGDPDSRQVVFIREPPVLVNGASEVIQAAARSRPFQMRNTGATNFLRIRAPATV